MHGTGILLIVRPLRVAQAVKSTSLQALFLLIALFIVVVDKASFPSSFLLKTATQLSPSSIYTSARAMFFGATPRGRYARK